MKEVGALAAGLGNRSSVVARYLFWELESRCHFPREWQHFTSSEGEHPSCYLSTQCESVRQAMTDLVGIGGETAQAGLGCKGEGNWYQALFC